MAILNPDHLFEQAERLFAPPPAGPPRQVDLRRAISSAYYGLFHYVLIKASDEFVGAKYRTKNRYGLVYRSIDHKALRELCWEVRKQTPSSKYQPYQPANGFGADLQEFARAAIELQETRHSADYDPLLRFRTSDASLARNCCPRRCPPLRADKPGSPKGIPDASCLPAAVTTSGLQ